MKANEIMVGDWVFVHKPTCKGHRVDYINEMEEEIGADGEFYNVCDIEPVPLTPEILEKNGFIVKRTESAKRTYWKDCAGQIVGHKNRGLMYMEISGNPVKFGYFLPHFSGHIQFVHELQHALRLCGISKEIVP